MCSKNPRPVVIYTHIMYIYKYNIKSKVHLEKLYKPFGQFQPELFTVDDSPQLTWCEL